MGVHTIFYIFHWKNTKSIKMYRSVKMQLIDTYLLHMELYPRQV
jgi:hypothetical protein